MAISPHGHHQYKAWLSALMATTRHGYQPSWPPSVQGMAISPHDHHKAWLSALMATISTRHGYQPSWPPQGMAISPHGHHCCSEPVKSAHLGCTLAYTPPADPDTLAPAPTESALSVWCRPSLFPIKTWVFGSHCLCGRVFISWFV